jgi:hypothetical protein
VYIENAPAGIYTIQVTNKGSLSDGIQDFPFAEGFDSSTLSATDFVKNDIVRLYPDTNKTILFFDLPIRSCLQSIMIYDSSGKLVRNVTENNRIV